MFKNTSAILALFVVCFMLIASSRSFQLVPFLSLRASRATGFVRRRIGENQFMETAASIRDTHNTNNSCNMSASAIISTQNTQMKAIITNDIHACGERLRLGELVAFPTETVYGLGCHALDVNAVAKVFAAKERPFTDPLIVHVLEPRDAFLLWKQNDCPILNQLCRDFWPGPLTLVAEASSAVPSTIMAGTGFCACRSPFHPTARALLESAQVPIAAPSANKFGHVSPTTAQHVLDDLQNENVWILETPGQEEGPCCNVGVESTVAKLEITENGRHVLTVLRQGAVSVQDIEVSLANYPVQVVAQLKRATQDNVANVAPGQTIRHYSPNIPSFLLSPSCMNSETDDDVLSHAVLIDYGGQFTHWKNKCLAYRDLTSDGTSSVAAQTVFETLRWAEQVSDARLVLFPELQPKSNDALALAVKDRLTRAASGVIIHRLDEASAAALTP